MRDHLGDLGRPLRPLVSQDFGPALARELAGRYGITPTKHWGQHFVVDPNTVRRIVRLADIGERDVVLEVGPGLGALTVGLLDQGCRVVAVEIDPVLAAALPHTVGELRPEAAGRLDVIATDALALGELPGPPPTALVSNLPYNVAVPVLLTLLERFDSLHSALVMVQLEVAQRLAAAPGGKDYGVPSVKAAWYGQVDLAGTVGRSVFWPVPRVESGLVRLRRRPPPTTSATRAEVFTCIDAAFAQRRKTLRAALSGWAGGPEAAQECVLAAGIDPQERGERLDIAAFASIAAHRPPRVRL